MVYRHRATQQSLRAVQSIVLRAMSLEGQVAVITGGAGGIGWASAEKWLGAGGKVAALTDVNSTA